MAAANGAMIFTIVSNVNTFCSFLSHSFDILPLSFRRNSGHRESGMDDLFILNRVLFFLNEPLPRVHAV
jgi:hypothetical protein